MHSRNKNQKPLSQGGKMVHSGDQVVWTRGEKLGGGNLVFIGIGIKKVRITCLEI